MGAGVTGEKQQQRMLSILKNAIQGNEENIEKAWCVEKTKYDFRNRQPLSIV